MKEEIERERERVREVYKGVIKREDGRTEK